MRVLVTGASGFIGAALVEALGRRGHTVRAAYRRIPAPAPRTDFAIVGELSWAEWGGALAGVDVVVHAAGPAHGRFGEAELMRASADGAERLTRQAEIAGVKKLVLVSSIKAVCAHTLPGSPATEALEPQPSDSYGRAKLAAERAVLSATRLQTVVLRAPLVFAAHAKANFRLLLQLADTPLPLPFAGLNGHRTLLALRSLTAAVAAAIGEGPGGVFHLGDRPSLCAAEIVAALRAGLGRPPGLFAFEDAERFLPAALSQSLEVDDARFRGTYGYGDAGVGDVRAELRACAAAWRGRRRRSRQRSGRWCWRGRSPSR